jgi:hypothetical protein
MTNDVNVPVVIPEFSGDDGFELVATPAVPHFRAAYMRFVKGTYECGAEREPVPPGTQFFVLGATGGWVRLARGEPVRRVPREAEKPFPQRSELGDTDETQWPLFDGKPSDPWTLSNELLLAEKETGRPVIFTTTSWTGREAVADLCLLITYQRRTRGRDARAIISIGVGAYRSRRGPVATPKFTIVGWVGGDDTPEPAPATAETGPTSFGPTSAGAELPASQLARDVTAHLEKRSTISATAQSTGPQERPRQKKPAPPPWEDNDLDDEISL